VRGLLGHHFEGATNIKIERKDDEIEQGPMIKMRRADDKSLGRKSAK
jgi:hypothetical protein